MLLNHSIHCLSVFLMSIVELVLNFGRLKRHVRTGWLSKGISKAHVESVAEHVLRTVFLSMVIADLTGQERNIDSELILRMALIHDLPEAVLKDIDKEAWAYLRLDSESKHKVEENAISDLLAEIPEKLQLKYREIFRKYMNGKLLEAKIVKSADKLEMAFQAYEYNKLGYSKELLEDMWKDAENEIKNINLTVAVKLFEELKSLHQAE